MTSRLKRLAFLSIVFSAAALAQGQFILRVQQGSNVFQIPNGSTLSLSSPSVGSARSIQLVVTYVGNTSVSFPDGITLLGSPAFSVPGGLPVSSLGPNQTATVEIVFNPSSPTQALAQLEIAFAEAAPPPATPETPPLPPTRGRLSVALAGGVPVYSLQYVIGATGNATAVPPGGQIAFPETVANTASIAAVAIQNRGAGNGAVASVSLSGGSFALASLPPLPAALATAASFAFQIVYQPRSVASDSATLAITFDGGITETYQITGRSIASQLSYELLSESGSSVVLPSQTITFPGTSIGNSATLQIRLTNISSSDVIVPAAVTTGPPFSVLGLQIFPLALAPGGTGLISIFFTPSLPERVSGGLRIGNDTFNLAGEGLGARFEYSYRTQSSSAATPVFPQGEVRLPSVSVGRSSAVEFRVANTGNTPGLINSIGISGGGEVFRVVDLPALPREIQPQTSITFRVQFLPNTTGFAGGSVRVESSTFALSGLGEEAVPLSDYTIGGPSQVGPLEQPAVTLTLGQPYPIPLTGTLNLLVASSYAADASVQFSTGGRAVNFTIPANSTRAVFPNGSNEIRLQTGSVASTFTLTPTFATAGGLNLTPASPAALRFAMPESPPRLLGVQVAERSLTTLTLRILGLTTTRSLSKMDVKFTAAPGFNVPTLDFPLDLAGASAVWFNSTASQAFGGQFNLDVQFQLSTSDRSTNALPPTQALASVSVTLTSATGSSNTVTIGLR